MLSTRPPVLQAALLAAPPRPVKTGLGLPAPRPCWTPSGQGAPAPAASRCQPVAPASSTAAAPPAWQDGSRPASAASTASRLGRVPQAVLAAGLVAGLAVGLQQSARHLPARAWLQALVESPAIDDPQAAAAAAEAATQAAAAADAAQAAASSDAAAPEALDADTLAQALSQELEGLALGDVSVSVGAEGQVVLSGTVSSPQTKASLLAATARLVPGVQIRDLVFVVEE